jgi:hypothetical protein
VISTPADVSDDAELVPLVERHEANTGCQVGTAVADTKYGTIDNYRWLEGRGIRAAIPFGEADSDERALPRSAFAYDPATDTYRCPTGAVLRRQGRTTTTAAHPLIIYRPRPRDCAACPLKERCCGKAQVRSLSRPDDGGLRDRTVAYLGTSRARRLIRQRKARAETVFGDGKERRGLRRARCRGLDNLSIQACLTATAQNLRQLALRRRRGPAEKAASAPLSQLQPRGGCRHYPPSRRAQGQHPLPHAAKRRSVVQRASRRKGGRSWARASFPR